MASLSNSFSSIASTAKKRRNPPGNPDPDAEVIALSPKTLLATNRYICEVCNKGFQRDQNLQLHRRGHNLPWNLKQKSSGGDVKKKVYVCPETTCTHHGPSRALGDLTGIKKHYSRKHGEKKWKCDKCTKRYAVQSDWKAHSKICGTKEYRCDCGTIFSRKDSFVTHRAFCEALNKENNEADHGLETMVRNLFSNSQTFLGHTINMSSSDLNTNTSLKSLSHNQLMLANSDMLFSNSSLRISGPSNLSMPGDDSFMSATALLQKTTDMGAKFSNESISPILLSGFTCLTNNNAPCLDTAEMSSNAGIQNSVQTRPDTAGFAPGLIRKASSVPFSVGKERKADSIHIKRDVDGRKGKMTQDFLGLSASGRVYVSSAENSSYHEDELYPYHQISHHLPTSFEKKMW